MFLFLRGLISSVKGKPALLSMRYHFSGSFAQAVARSLAAKTPQQQSCPLTFAEKVLDRVDKQFYSQPNINKLKAKVDLEQQIEQLQNQLKQEISRALRKTQEKLIVLLAATNATHKHLEAMNAFHGDKFLLKERSLILDFNRLVKQCFQARWALIVQRQCAGFTIRNHELVCGLYPIPPAILIDS